MKNILNLCLCLLISIPLSFGQNQVTININVTDSFENPVDSTLINIYGDSNCGDSIFIQTFTDVNGTATSAFVTDCEVGNLYIEAICFDGSVSSQDLVWTPNQFSLNANFEFFCDLDPVIDCIDPNLIDSLAICTTEYDPVCGCNGVTYGNSCEAELWGGVTSWTAGACQIDSTGCNNFNAIITYNTNSDDSYDLVVSASGGTPPYTYDWGNGIFAPAFTVFAPGTYCINVIDSQGCTVSTCTDVQGNNPTDSCSVWISYEANPNSGDTYLLEAEAFGTAPYIYSWSTGETTSSILATADGTYCVDMFDAVGCLSSYCVDIYQDSTWNGGNDCYDWSVINFEADCPEIYDPVCGCDNVTYDNACFAEYCFGIIDWTAGPCANTGSNDNPTDSLGLCTASFDYTIEETDAGIVTITCSASAEGSAPFSYEWTVEDDIILTDQTFSYDIVLQDSFTVFPVCLYSVDSDGCSALVCETIIIDIDPDGIIDGTITENDGLVDDNEILAKSGNGDPLPNITVTLLNVSGDLLETTQTNETGTYRFDKLYFGDYFIQVLIDGIEHEPFHIKLNPIVQSVLNTDFEVSETSVQTTATQELTSINDVILFPNPVSEQLNIQFDGLTQEAVQIVIYDVNGRQLHQENRSTLLGSQQWTIPVSSFSDGIYMLSIQTKNGVMSQRFVK